MADPFRLHSLHHDDCLSHVYDDHPEHHTHARRESYYGSAECHTPESRHTCTEKTSSAAGVPYEDDGLPTYGFVVDVVNVLASSVPTAACGRAEHTAASSSGGPGGGGGGGEAGMLALQMQTTRSDAGALLARLCTAT